MSQHFGYIALLGRPNAGKSSLMNSCLGQKLAGVSRKPQTTRDQIAGILTDQTHQMVFLDTPGIHRAKKPTHLNRLMNKAAWSTLKQAHVICYLIDGVSGWHEEDEEYLLKIREEAACPIWLFLTKSDKVKKKELMIHKAFIEGQSAAKDLTISIISSKTPEQIAWFKDFCRNHIPQGDWIYPEDDLTDKPETFIVSEMIREQLFRQLGQEVPYGTHVEVHPWGEASGSVFHIQATIIVAHANHKPIVLGRQGAQIKRIGEESRKTLEIHFGQKVFLELFVKVS